MWKVVFLTEHYATMYSRLFELIQSVGVRIPNQTKSGLDVLDLLLTERGVHFLKFIQEISGNSWEYLEIPGVIWEDLGRPGKT